MILRHILESAHWEHFGDFAHNLEHEIHSGRRRFGGRGDFGGRGGFGRGRGPRGGFGRGRKLDSAELQLVILALLSEKPSHGYELIKALDERSGGFYHPSPGVIYPALTYLEEIGLATSVAEGTRKLYHLTDDGRAHLEAHRAEADEMLGEFSRIGARMDDVRRVMEGEDTGAPGSVHAARHALRRALHAKLHASADEAARIAEILMRAAREIAGE